jgi:hypothetical protein
MALAVALLWSATASSKLSAAESPIPSVGPASCVQPQPADAMWTLGSSSPVELAINWQPILQVATDWHAKLSRVQWTFDNEPRLAQNDAEPGEPVEAGDPQRDPCYISPPLDTLRANIASPPGMLPDDIAAHCRDATPLREDARMIDGWACYNKHWSATGMRHRPLYFEEINAERYGYTCCGPCLQPLVSAGHFLATIPTLPYQLFVRPPCQCTYTLGHYRPGSCVPYRCSRLPCRVGAGVFEAVVIVGLVALIP